MINIQLKKLIKLLDGCFIPKEKVTSVLVLIDQLSQILCIKLSEILQQNTSIKISDSKIK